MIQSCDFGILTTDELSATVWLKGGGTNQGQKNKGSQPRGSNDKLRCSANALTVVEKTACSRVGENRSNDTGS